MRTRIFAVLAVVLAVVNLSASAARIDFVEKANKIDVKADGKLITSYLHAIDEKEPMFRKNCVLAKPVLFPVYSPSGEMITRGYPFIDVAGEKQDHPHHMGIYFTVDINKEHFWGNSKEELPRIQHVKVTKMQGGQGVGTLSTVSHWIGSDGGIMLEETRQMVFIAPENADYYAIEFNISLKAIGKKIVFGDTKEGMMAIRVAPWLKETGGGKYLSSEGKETEKNVWGRRAKWMRLEGKTDGKSYGVTILNHPESTNYPTFWHARGYGCFTANPLGQGAFEKSHKVEGAKNLDLTLESGESAHFKHRMIIYEGTRTKEQVDKEFDDYVDGGHTYELAYAQDFDGASAIKDFEFTNPEKWQFDDKGNGSGCLRFLGPGKYKPKVRSPIVIGLISDRMFGDFILEADLLQTGKEYGHRDMCLFYNFQDPSHFYYTHIASAADPHAHNIFIVNDKPRTAIATKTTKGIDWGKNAWHKVRLERKLADGTIKVFYDDMNTPIMTAMDKTFGMGYIGFGTFDDSGKIDNIKIYAPQSKEKRSNFFRKK